MKLAFSLLTFVAPVLVQAAATSISVPLASHRDSTVGNVRSCMYQTDLRLGAGEAVKPFQVFVELENEEGILRQIEVPLRRDDGGFFLKLVGFKEVALGAECPAFIERVVVR